MWDSSAGLHLYHTVLYMVNFGFTILRMHATHDVLISCMQEVYATRSVCNCCLWFAMASQLPKGPGCPINVPGELPQSVTIENTESGDVLSLLVPNRLLFKWFQDHTISASFYLLLLNAAVLNQVVQVDVGSEELAQKICQRAGSVYRYTRRKSGQARMEFLKQKSIISISHTDVIKVTHLQEEIMELKEYVTELRCDITNAMEEHVLCQEAVESMSTQLKQVLMEWDEMVNTGAAYECVSTRQKKKKNEIWLSLKEQLFGLVNILALYQNS